MLEFFNLLGIIWALIANTWWVWLPIALFFLVKEFYKIFLRIRYFANLKWVLLEIKIPRDIAKTPEAMEQIFAGLQTMYFVLDPKERWIQGLQHDYMIFEMASMGGETHFYARVPVFFRSVLESLIYAQYPEVEVAEVDDYMKLLPEQVPNQDWDLFGVEFRLAKEDAYPIRTYVDYQALKPGQEEYEKVDPFAAMVEILGKLRPGEHAGYHLLIRPTPSDKWKVEGQALIDKLLARPEKKNGSVGAALRPLGTELIGALGTIATGTTPEPQKKEEKSGMTVVPPDVDALVKALIKSITKPGFETIVRFNYIARRDVFHLATFSAFIGALKQFNTLTLNGFVLNGATLAGSVPWWWPDFIARPRKQHKKSIFYQYYRARKPFSDTFTLRQKIIVLNTEELATIYHFPGRGARGPLLPRIEARRSEPPASLPVS